MSIEGEDIALTEWEEGPYSGALLVLPFDLDQIANPLTLDNLTPDQLEFLATNGFVVVHSQEAQFRDVRVATCIKTGQPYYLTTDSAFHALHLHFDDLLKLIERDYFRPQMVIITQSTLEQLRATYLQAQGTSLETEAQQALAYMSVALKLFDPGANIDMAVADLVTQQVNQIIAANGVDTSAIFPDFKDDYGAYLPVGHYAGDPNLESYFRAMTWFGRMHFLLQNPDELNFVPSRLPLIITMAMRSAQVDGIPASDLWTQVHKTLTFIIGPSDDAGPLEYATLMDQVYGDHPTVQMIADQSLWDAFLSQSDQLPMPQVNSLFIYSTVDLAPFKGWRFMGQRFTLDATILQNLVFDKLPPKPDGTKRELPSGLDVMAAFGSTSAYQLLDSQGITSFPNYPDQVEKMQLAVQEQSQEQWLARFYDGWLYAFIPVLQPKNASYPANMQTLAWSYKDLSTALGSWAELKHDTALYTKMPERAGGGGPPLSDPAPSYVEPNPRVFYRLSYISRALSCGLQDLLLHQPCDLNSQYMQSVDLPTLIIALGQLGVRFESLGDIAAKELAGLPLDEDDNLEITSCLGLNECLNTDTGYNQPAGQMPELPVIAAVAGADQQVLSVGVGYVDRIYVLVPLENQWEIAQGGIFSYYEFTQPRAQRLTDDAWREKLATGEAQLPDWTTNLILPGGQPTESLFFRVGDVYKVTIAGDDLRMRQDPSLKGGIITAVHTGDFLEIVDGPLMSDGYTWWKFSLFSWTSDTPIQGWAVENLGWYVRSYRPDQPDE